MSENGRSVQITLYGPMAAQHKYDKRRWQSFKSWHLQKCEVLKQESRYAGQQRINDSSKLVDESGQESVVLKRQDIMDQMA